MDNRLETLAHTLWRLLNQRQVERGREDAQLPRSELTLIRKALEAVLPQKP